MSEFYQDFRDIHEGLTSINQENSRFAGDEFLIKFFSKEEAASLLEYSNQPFAGKNRLVSYETNGDVNGVISASGLVIFEEGSNFNNSPIGDLVTNRSKLTSEGSGQKAFSTKGSEVGKSSKSNRPHTVVNTWIPGKALWAPFNEENPERLDFGQLFEYLSYDPDLGRGKGVNDTTRVTLDFIHEGINNSIFEEAVRSNFGTMFDGMLEVYLTGITSRVLMYENSNEDFMRVLLSVSSFHLFARQVREGNANANAKALINEHQQKRGGSKVLARMKARKEAAKQPAPTTQQPAPATQQPAPASATQQPAPAPATQQPEPEAPATKQPEPAPATKQSPSEPLAVAKLREQGFGNLADWMVANHLVSPKDKGKPNARIRTLLATAKHDGEENAKVFLKTHFEGASSAPKEVPAPSIPNPLAGRQRKSEEASQEPKKPGKTLFGALESKESSDKEEKSW